MHANISMHALTVKNCSVPKPATAVSFVLTAPSPALPSGSNEDAAGDVGFHYPVAAARRMASSGGIVVGAMGRFGTTISNGHSCVQNVPLTALRRTPIIAGQFRSR
jgi:hypothetical protein